MKSLIQSCAKVIYSDHYRDIFELPVLDVLDWFRFHGLLLFRGFEVDDKKMQAFAEQFSSRFIRDPQKETVGSINGVVQLVVNGIDDFGLHSENASSPYRPDVVCFCCAVPAARDGETIVCDGVRVWQELSNSIQSLFLSQKIQYEHNFPVEQWRSFFGSGTTIVDVKKALDEIDGISYSVDKNQAVALKYTCSAVVKTKFDSQDSFANSILIEYENQDVLLEDGSEIPNAVIEEVKEITEKLTQEIRWQPGDLVMIDNSRFMHGRRAFTDMRRKIYTNLSYLKPELVNYIVN